MSNDDAHDNRDGAAPKAPAAAVAPGTAMPSASGGSTKPGAHSRGEAMARALKPSAPKPRTRGRAKSGKPTAPPEIAGETGTAPLPGTHSSGADYLGADFPGADYPGAHYLGAHYPGALAPQAHSSGPAGVANDTNDAAAPVVAAPVVAAPVAAAPVVAAPVVAAPVVAASVAVASDANAAADAAADVQSGSESDAPPDPATPTGPGVIARHLRHLPNAPGVYRMYDDKGECHYVGKARSLKKRVQSYARLGGHTNRIARMIASTAAMEFVTTRTESEALLLEANLIKRLKPRFNVLMRDDKSFPYILISRDHEAAQILKHRGARNRQGAYFGPFASAGAVTRTINTLQRAFLLRTCSDAVYESRTRPCLLHQIKRCSAPCTGEIGPEDYNALVEEATRFLRGESKSVQAKLNELMSTAAEALEFERAAQYRNRLWALAHVQASSGIAPNNVEEADVFAAHSDGGLTCIQVFFFRTGQNWGNRAYFPRADRTVPVDEVLEAFIAQFYDDKPVPRLLLVSHDLPMCELLAEALSTKAGRKVEITLPQRGEKRELVDHAIANAREAHGRRLADSASQRRLLAGVAEAFGLQRPPERIEVYDNSHIQGANAVGAMIVAGPDGFMKNQYRKFNIKDTTLSPGDDFAMMQEVLARRFKRLLRDHGEARLEAGIAGSNPMLVADPASKASIEEPVEAQDLGLANGAPAWPDLLLIDGGKGQVGVVKAVLNELGLADIRIVGVAKGPDRDAGREHFHIPGREPFMLEPRDPVLYYIQRLRDEAHRFAIGTHRAKRKKDLVSNPLDEIAGIGQSRRRALLKHFGSAKSVSRAGVKDLTAVDGISQAMAQAIYDHFHDTAR